MSATTVEHEELMAKAEKSFLQVIGEKLESAWNWLWKHVTKAGAAVADGVTTVASAVWDFTCWSARKGWSGLKATGKAGGWLAVHTLMWGGRGVYYAVWFATEIVLFLFTLLVSGLVLGLNGLVITTEYLAFLVIKVGYFLGLVLCSPWIAWHSTEALKTDWALFVHSLHPKRWHVVFPSQLAFDLDSAEFDPDEPAPVPPQGKPAYAAPRSFGRHVRRMAATVPSHA